MSSEFVAVQSRLCDGPVNVSSTDGDFVNIVCALRDPGVEADITSFSVHLASGRLYAAGKEPPTPPSW